MLLLDHRLPVAVEAMPPAPCATPAVHHSTNSKNALAHQNTQALVGSQILIALPLFLRNQTALLLVIQLFQ